MATFKTAYLQREVIEDAAVVGTTTGQEAFRVGDYVKFTPATSTVSPYVKKSTIADATHIVAQSDMTLEYGHVPVEIRDYRYSPIVKATVTAVPSDLTAPVKKVALFRITNKEDVIPDADGKDHK